MRTAVLFGTWAGPQKLREPYAPSQYCNASGLCDREVRSRGDRQKEVPMQKRPLHSKAYPEALEAMLALSQAVQKTGLAPQLIALVNYRVSQLNGCAYCLDMHSKDLRARGETEQRLYMISAWREARGAPSLQRSRARCAGMGRSRDPA